MTKVIIKKTDSYDHSALYGSVKEIMLWGRLQDVIHPDTTILLKPNMLSRSAPDKAVTTHPAVVDAVITVLKEFGAQAENITIGDSSGRAVQPGSAAGKLLRLRLHADSGQTGGKPVHQTG
ncbi:MAG: DUF362 domain-containing protein [Oscillospiraceae bacterium]|nr:DUF362 domain-containing protein [Oscillospiraceae bacterium]